MMPTDAELAWLAGIVDGEGTIGLHRTNAKQNPHPYLRPHFQIVNTDVRILAKVARIIFDLTDKPHNLVVTNKGGNGLKRGYRLAVNTQWELLVVLPALVPFMASKCEQAAIVLAFCKRRLSRGSCHWYEFKEEDDACYARCRELNRRGDGSQRSALH